MTESTAWTVEKLESEGWAFVCDTNTHYRPLWDSFLQVGDDRNHFRNSEGVEIRRTFYGFYYLQPGGKIEAREVTGDVPRIPIPHGAPVEYAEYAQRELTAVVEAANRNRRWILENVGGQIVETQIG